MPAKIASSALVTAFLAFSAVSAYAQGSITQDPGRAAPGNWTGGTLGPTTSAPVTSGAGPFSGSAGSSLVNPPSTTETTGGTTVFHGTPRGSSSSTAPGPLASPPSGAGRP